MVLAGAVVPLALALGGCGGSGAQSATEYREQAEAICAEMNREIETQPTPRTAAEYGRYLDELLAVLGPALDKLDGLRPPSDLRVRHERALRLAHRGEAFLRRIARGIHQGQNALQLALVYGTQADQAIARANAILRDLDLPECAKDPQPRKQPPPA